MVKRDGVSYETIINFLTVSTLRKLTFKLDNFYFHVFYPLLPHRGKCVPNLFVIPSNLFGILRNLFGFRIKCLEFRINCHNSGLIFFSVPTKYLLKHMNFISV